MCYWPNSCKNPWWQRKSLISRRLKTLNFRAYFAWKKLWKGLKLSSLKFNLLNVFQNFWIWVPGSRHSRELCVIWKFGTLICSTKFVFYLSKSTLKSCMEYCYHVCVCASSCYLRMLDKLQKWDCRTVGPSLSTYHEQLVCRCLNVASLSLF